MEWASTSAACLRRGASVRSLPFGQRPSALLFLLFFNAQRLQPDLLRATGMHVAPALVPLLRPAGIAPEGPAHVRQLPEESGSELAVNEIPRGHRSHLAPD